MPRGVSFGAARRPEQASNETAHALEGIAVRQRPVRDGGMCAAAAREHLREQPPYENGRDP